MKKYIILLLALLLILGGCDKVTQSSNTKTANLQPEANVKEDALDTKELAIDSIAPIYNRNLLKSNKKEMSLEDIIKKMKATLELGNEYDQVSSEEYSGEGEEKTYNVNLYDSKNENGAYFSTDIYGNLIYFGRYESNYKVINNYSKEEAEEKALDFLVELYGEGARDFEIQDIPGYNSFENQSYSLSVVRVVNGVQVPSDTIYIDVNKENLNIMSFNVTTQTGYDFSDESYFAQVGEIVGEDEAFSAFKEANKLYKGYLGISEDYTGIYRNLKYLPIYGIYGSQIPIDAVTLEGNYLLTDDYISMAGMGATEEMVADSELGSAEEEHLEDVKNQKSLEDAEKVAREMFELGQDYKLAYSNFSNYNQIKGAYVWGLSFTGENNENVSITLFAKDLSLINYSFYEGNWDRRSNENVPNKDPEDYVSIANAFLNEKGKMSLDELELVPRSSQPQSDTRHRLVYIRKADESYIYSDNITIVVDKKNDKVVEYYKNWNGNLGDYTLPETFAFGEEEAYEIFKEKYGFNLVYKRDGLETGDKPVKLFFELGMAKHYYINQDYIVNGETGVLINSNGDTVSLASKLEYSDLDRAERPEIIERMAENNIGFSGGELKPKEKITQLDLFKLFVISNYYYGEIEDLSTEEVYKSLEYLNLLEDEDQKPDMIIKQRDFARYVARFMNYGDIGRLNEIFKDKYEDINSQDEDFGYLTLAKEKGYIESDENKLNPDKELTREMALYYLYAVKSKK